MSTSPPSLDQLRAEIDRIDDQIHDLVMQRTGVVRQIGAVKGSTLPRLRPAREALILRRLLARHQGPLPAAVLVRMWREMIAGLTWLQGPYAVAVHVHSPERCGAWDLARDHFGSFTPMTAVNSPVAAIRAVSEGTAAVGVVPFPAEEDADPWWRFLNADDGRTPRVVARLPFYPGGNGRGDDCDVLAIALVPHEPTGDDRTLIRIELDEDLSRGRLKEALDASGLAQPGIGRWLSTNGTGPVHLVEIADYIGNADPRLAACADRLAGHGLRITTIGGYAVPLPAPVEPRKP
jgi:chorismate mutase